MSSKRCNVLLTLAGRKAYQCLAFKAAKSAGTVLAVDADASAPVKARGFPLEVVPRIDEPSKYIDALKRCIEKHEIDCVIPMNDLDVELLALHREELCVTGAKVMTADAQTVAALSDKLVASSWLTERGFLTPVTWTVSESLRGLRSRDFPIVTKARRGQGSAGFSVIRSDPQLDMVAPDAILQPLLEGEHYDLDILRSAAGRVIAVVPKRKLEMQAGTATLVRSDDNPGLLELGVRLGNAVQHLGMIDADIVVVGNDFYVLEINPRLGGCFPFGCMACPGLAEAVLQVGLGEEPTDLLGNVRSGVTMYREWNYIEVT